MIGKDYIDWTQSACQKAAVVSGNTYRFSVLTPYMIRMEYAADGVFEDRATQAVAILVSLIFASKTTESCWKF